MNMFKCQYCGFTNEMLNVERFDDGLPKRFLCPYCKELTIFTEKDRQAVKNWKGGDGIGWLIIGLFICMVFAGMIVYELGELKTFLLFSGIVVCIFCYGRYKEANDLRKKVDLMADQ